MWELPGLNERKRKHGPGNPLLMIISGIVSAGQVVVVFLPVDQVRIVL
jgi:hypothetical protein